MMAGMDDVTRHYETETLEHTRLHRSAHGRMEYLRTRELLGRRLPPAAARILDVGGGTGVHAEWLAAEGHRVCLVDPVPGHVRAAATLPRVSAVRADARRLPIADRSMDVVLLLGPLYHLIDRTDRLAALREAARVLHPDGLLAAGGISRYTSLLASTAAGRLTGELLPRMASLLATGRYDGHAGFMPAHFHTADELSREVEAAGLRDATAFGVEGPAWPALDEVGLSELEARAPAALAGARLVEQDPLIINASAHLLVLARR
jgi:ubiquinone/menaquinone biosynthesis C-methylase UbiE